MISPNITNKGGLNYVFSKTFYSYLLLDIVIAVTVYLIYLFVLCIYYIIFYLFCQ